MSNFQVAFSAILKYGTPKQRDIIRDIQKSSMILKIESVTGGSADTGLYDTAATQQENRYAKIKRSAGVRRN